MFNRFKRDIAKYVFTCYDCHANTDIGSAFSWDNERNCRVCMNCLEIIENEIKKLAALGRKDRWSANSPKKPWEMGDWDIESWPEQLRKEYYELERAAVRNRYAVKDAA